MDQSDGCRGYIDNAQSMHMSVLLHSAEKLGACTIVWGTARIFFAPTMNYDLEFRLAGQYSLVGLSKQSLNRVGYAITSHV